VLELVVVESGDSTSVAACGLLGESAAMKSLATSIERAAHHRSSVLLSGETGTGKDLAARAIHQLGPRSEAPFEIVDCGALSPTLIASELFGHERGAFTGADRQHLGAFERADGGTLFLDEIAELPLQVQATLLGALERRSFRRVGGSRSISVDVRLITATHRDLKAALEKGAFRQDLYYRIAGLRLPVPSLRERSTDIPLLLEYFLRQAGFDGPTAELISPAMMRRLMSHRWPGNLRELRNVAESILVTGQIPTDVGPTCGTTVPWDEEVTATAEPPEVLELPYTEARGRVLHHFESAYFARLLKECQGNVSVAAREAKMSRSHLIELLKRHRLG
jgi:DNA-binding NtrC family response regulator